METNVMIKNSSDYSLTEIYEYLAGYTTKLNGKIEVRTIKGPFKILKGIHYDTIIVQNK